MKETYAVIRWLRKKVKSVELLQVLQIKKIGTQKN